MSTGCGHEIEDIYANLVDQGMPGSSVRKLHWAMRQALAWAHKWGLTRVVTTGDVELPPLREKKVDPPSSDAVCTPVEHVLGFDPD